LSHQAKKRFGQNFLKDKNLLKKIVDKAEIKDQFVIEIGPGQGALTGFLAQAAKHVKAYEIDYSLEPILSAIQKEYDNLEIIYQDFLKIDLNQLSKPHHVVANVPYYITTPILFKLLESNNIASATMMIQKEVCDRIMATPKDKQYNALSIIVQSMAEVKKVMDVKRQLFYPVPNVDSAVIRLKMYDVPKLNAKGIILVKAAFQQKRKTLVNNLHQAYGIEKPLLEQFLIDQKIDPNIRAEDLTLDDFIKLNDVWAFKNTSLKT
jgi:16S rRNA (adenine1518-N6/adenine1519-N6)-dimethyltransferase